MCILKQIMTQSGGFASSSTSREWSPQFIDLAKSRKIKAGGMLEETVICWFKFTVFILEFLPMLVKHPLSHLKCLVLISSISYKVPFGGSVTDCSESDGSSAGTYCSAVTHCHYDGCVFLPLYFFHVFFRVLLWAQNILFFLFYKEKLEYREMKGQIVQKHLGIERFRWALHIIFRRTSAPYS